MKYNVTPEDACPLATRWSEAETASAAARSFCWAVRPTDGTMLSVTLTTDRRVHRWFYEVIDPDQVSVVRRNRSHPKVRAAGWVEADEWARPDGPTV